MVLNKRKIVFITGFQKNCGKTTFLNYLLKNYREKDKIFCTSIGVDTAFDDIYLKSKPFVEIKKGWICLTNSVFLNSVYDYEIKEVIQNSIMGGYPVVISPKNDIKIRLSSPGSNQDLKEIIEKIRDVEYVFVDGSVDRITQVSIFPNSEFYYVFKVDYSSVDLVWDRIMLLELISKLKIKKSEYDFLSSLKDDVFIYYKTMYIKGAFSESKLEKIKDIKNIVIMDFTKVFLNYRQFKKLVEDVNVYFTLPLNLNKYVINLYDISFNDFEKRFQADVRKRFLYNPYYANS
jgi:hypothetical protein